jgi:hypothetical protein
MAWEAKNGAKLPKMEIPGQLNSSPDFEGTYSTLVGKVDIRQKSSNRYSVKTSYGTFYLDRGENGGYRLNYRLLGIVPIDLEELSEMVFTTDTISGQHVIVGGSNDHRFAGVRLVPHPIHEAWKHRSGQYKLLNPPEVYKFWQIGNPELKIEDDYLVSATPGPEGDSTLVLRTVNAREAIIEPKKIS